MNMVLMSVLSRTFIFKSIDLTPQKQCPSCWIVKCFGALGRNNF